MEISNVHYTLKTSDYITTGYSIYCDISTSEFNKILRKCNPNIDKFIPGKGGVKGKVMTSHDIIHTSIQ